MNFKCILCGENRAITVNKIVRDSSDHEVVKCSSCGHTQLYPMPTVFEDENYYNEDLQNKSTHSETNIDINDIKQKSDWDTKRRFEQVLGYVDKNTRVLEIGSGYGFFVESMEQNGYKIEGLEVSKCRRQYCETICKSELYSLNLIKEDVPKDMLGQFEVIVMFQVLEHITDPVPFMKKVKSMLVPGGKLIIEVPNADDHLLSFCGTYSNFFWQRAHVSYFYADTLKKLFELSGLKEISMKGIQRYGIQNLINWITLGKPQLEKPSYTTQKELEWLEKYYKEKLEQELRSDTLLAVVESI